MQTGTLFDPHCVFCGIAQGSLPCAQIYADKHILAFLDIAPVNKGHTLVIPRQHYRDIFSVPPELGEKLVRAQQRVGQAILAATGAEGLNIYMNNRPAAGQMVFHAHWHLIPRHTDDGLALWPQNRYDSEDEMRALASRIINSLGNP